MLHSIQILFPLFLILFFYPSIPWSVSIRLALIDKHKVHLTNSVQRSFVSLTVMLILSLQLIEKKVRGRLSKTSQFILFELAVKTSSLIAIVSPDMWTQYNWFINQSIMREQNFSSFWNLYLPFFILYMSQNFPSSQWVLSDLSQIAEPACYSEQFAIRHHREGGRVTKTKIKLKENRFCALKILFIFQIVFGFKLKTEIIFFFFLDEWVGINWHLCGLI